MADPVTQAPKPFWLISPRELFVATLVVVLSCVLWRAMPHTISPYEPLRSKVGMTTSQVHEMLGEPNRRKTYPDGRQLWTYFEDFIGIQCFYIEFDDQGVATADWI